MKKFIMVLSVSFLVLAGCGRKVNRVSPQTVIDLSGRWNDTDSRLVAETMINDCLNHPWLSEFLTKYGRKPVIVVGGIRNLSSEHIPVQTFINDIERAFVNSGKIRVVANAAERLQIREERKQQIDWASPETRKRLRNELGADFMMIGDISSIEDQEGGKKVIFYQVDLELVNLETNEKVWIGTKKIKKYITRGAVKL